METKKLDRICMGISITGLIIGIGLIITGKMTLFNFVNTFGISIALYLITTRTLMGFGLTLLIVVYSLIDSIIVKKITPVDILYSIGVILMVSDRGIIEIKNIENKSIIEKIKTHRIKFNIKIAWLEKFVVAIACFNIIMGGLIERGGLHGVLSNYWSLAPIILIIIYDYNGLSHITGLVFIGMALLNSLLYIDNKVLAIYYVNLIAITIISLINVERERRVIKREQKELEIKQGEALSEEGV